MALTLNANSAHVFRITHRENVPWILDNGMYARNGAKFDPNCRNIGNVDLIDKRARRKVPIPPGGTLSDYVPFYFTPYSIMMYNIKTGYGVQQVPNDEIVIFVSSLFHLTRNGCCFLFTDQHAYPPMADYYSDMADLPQIDWGILDRRDFKHDPDDPGKKERYQAEALAWKHVPLNALLGLCCYSADVPDQLKQQVETRGLTFNVAVQRNWYFR